MKYLKLILAVLAIGLLCGFSGGGGGGGGVPAGTLWLPNGVAYAAATNAFGLAQNTTACWGFQWPYQQTVNNIVLNVSTGGGGTDLYSACIYDSTGALVGKFAPNTLSTTGIQNVATTAQFTINPLTPYVFCMTTNAATPALRIYVRSVADVPEWYQNNTTPGGTTTGGACAASITAPVKSYTQAVNRPWFGFN